MLASHGEPPRHDHPPRFRFTVSSTSLQEDLAPLSRDNLNLFVHH